VDSCQALARSCQHLIFFPGKTEHFYWLRTKELCWEASAVSFNFFFVFLSSFLDFSQHLLNFCLDFLSSFKNRAKIQMFLTQNEPDTITWHVRSALCTLLLRTYRKKPQKSHIKISKKIPKTPIKTHKTLKKKY